MGAGECCGVAGGGGVGWALLVEACVRVPSARLVGLLSSSLFLFLPSNFLFLHSRAISVTFCFAFLPRLTPPMLPARIRGEESKLTRKSVGAPGATYSHFQLLNGTEI